MQVEVKDRSLLTHRQSHHVVEWEDRGGGKPPPHLPQGVPDVPSLLTKTLIEAPVTSSGVLGRGIKPDQPPDSLFRTAM